MKVENIKVQLVGGLSQGTSSTTGKSWANRNILLAFEDEDGEGYINAVVDEDFWKSLGYKEGDIAWKFSNGYVINDVRIVKG